MNVLPKIIAVVGTTASGKSALAIDIAKQFNGEIISVDSRQIYQGMDIGTNKEPGAIVPAVRTDVPTVNLPADCPVTLADVLSRPYVVDGILHYMISVVRPDQTLTLAHFKALAEGVINDIVSRGKTLILAGGTGLYVTALLQNWQVPQGLPNPDRRATLSGMTVDGLVAVLRNIDPDALATIDSKNPRRLIRAIEMAEEGQGAGRAKKGPALYNALIIGPQVEKDVLFKRIDARVDAMIKAGLVDEVTAVATKYGFDSVAMTGHAYQQIGWFLQGKISLDEAIELSKKVTRAYAKRQLTWWRKYGPVAFVQTSEQAKALVADFLRISAQNA